MKKGQTRAAAIRETKRSEILESLKNRGLVQQIIESADKLANLDEELDALKVQRIKASCDIRLAMVKKYLPDVKQSELTGPEGGEIKTSSTITFVPANIDEED